MWNPLNNLNNNRPGCMVPTKAIKTQKKKKNIQKIALLIYNIYLSLFMCSCSGGSQHGRAKIQINNFNTLSNKIKHYNSGSQMSWWLHTHSQKIKNISSMSLIKIFYWLYYCEQYYKLLYRLDVYEFMEFIPHLIYTLIKAHPILIILITFNIHTPLI